MWLSSEGNIPKLAPFDFRIPRSPDDPFLPVRDPLGPAAARRARRRRCGMRRRGVHDADGRPEARNDDLRGIPVDRRGRPRQGRGRALARAAEPGPDRRRACTSSCSRRSPASAATLALSAQAYADLAQQDARPARWPSAPPEIALHARMPEAAIESAKVWAEASAREQPRALGDRGRACSSAPTASTRPQPYLQKRILAAAEREGRGDGFLQLNRLLAQQSRQGGERCARCSSLARAVPGLSRRPALRSRPARPPAPGQDELALKEIRAAARLKPDWEAAVLLEAQLLQTGSDSGAAAIRAPVALSAALPELARGAPRLCAGPGGGPAICGGAQRVPEAAGRLSRQYRGHLRGCPALAAAIGLRARRIQSQAAA